MSSNNDHVLITMRQMALNRAQAELRSVLETYWGEEDKWIRNTVENLISEFNDEIDEWVR